MSISKQEKKQEEDTIIALLNEFHHDIPLFALTVFGSTLREKQIEFVRAFQANKRVTFKGGVGFGKTHALAILVWWSLFTHDDVQVTIYGPNQGQLERGIWKELQILYGRMDETFQGWFTVNNEKIRRNHNHASCMASYALASPDNVAAARGLHQKNNFIFVDEATGVPDFIYNEALINIIRDPNAKLCLISNPSTTSGYFWETWNGTIAKLWTHVHGRMTDAPHITAQDLEDAAIDYGGKDSRLYRIMVEGEFPDNDTDGLIPRWAVEEAVDNPDAVPAPTYPVIWGLDPADGGDRSVLVKRHDNKIIGICKWNGTDLMQLAMKVRDEYEATPPKLRPKAICVDANGVGNGAYVNLHYMGLPARKIMVQNSPTRKPEFYSRLRDQIWWECREWFLNGGLSIPNNDDLIKELVTPTYDSDNGKIKVEKKDSIRKRLKGNSPDFADALCLTFAISPTRYASQFNLDRFMSSPQNLSQYE
ncbi:terminase large subunit domain-containing protein [Ensifer sp. SL37]|uniref:terminase large subunit domain-containing protein n=1 Tax=Ensifer sp. SL37 TaxID=2995137 RepID=UPI00227444CF|nr:terminase family protein [Ensifer sp. SL37]MCY1741427.1 hypothetical protein [Ensifer sp. SL37]